MLIWNDATKNPPELNKRVIVRISDYKGQLDATGGFLTKSGWRLDISNAYLFQVKDWAAIS